MKTRCGGIPLDGSILKNYCLGTTIFIAAALLLAATSCGKGDTRSSEAVVIRVGTHNRPAHDPTWRDALTGDPGMTPDGIRVGEIAMQKVRDELGVKLEWVQYSADIRETLLRSVLAGDPFCEIAFLWGGSPGAIMGQNILQDLSLYADVFEGDPDAEWMLLPPVFGRRYFMGYKLAQVDCWPLVFNINYIEQVDALKENGRTVYPTDLYKQGKWTWSVFEDYLEKIHIYYHKLPSPVRPEIPIKAFQTDWRFTATALLHSAGGAVYGENGLGVDTRECIRAIEFLDRLMTRNLAMSVNYENSIIPGWTWGGNDLGNGETVFTDMPFWVDTSAGSNLASRGESMGIIPYPRPDDMAFNDPRYQHVMAAGGDCYAILKGVSPDKSRLALEAMKLYFLTTYRVISSSERALDFLAATAGEMAVADGFDIFHEEIGEDILNIYAQYSPRIINEFSGLAGVGGLWEETVGNSLYGVDGSPKYAVAIARNKALLENTIAEFEASITSGAIPIILNEHGE